MITKKLTYLLVRCIEEGKNQTSISDPLLERDMRHVSRRKQSGREFKMTTELGSYEMEGVILDLGSDVDILLKKSWELMGKPKLVWSPIHLRLANQYRIYPIGRLEKVEVNNDGARQKQTLKQ